MNDSSKAKGKTQKKILDKECTKEGYLEEEKNLIQLLNQIKNHSQVLIYRLNLRERRYDFMSKVQNSKTNYTTEEVVDMGLDNFSKLVHPEDVKPILRILSSINPNEKYKGKTKFQIEYRLMSKTDEYYWKKDAFEVVINEMGYPEYIIGNLQDITDYKKTEFELGKKIKEQKKIEEKLRSSERKLKYSQNLANIGSYSVDLEIKGDKLNSNIMLSDELKKIIGITNEELTLDYDYLIKKLIHPDYAPKISSILKNLPHLHSIGEDTIDFRIIHPKKGERWLRAFSTIQEKKSGNGNQKILVVGSIQDITLQKELEEERTRNQKMESIGILAGGIAHDFNNLLTGIIGNIELLQLEEKNRESLEILDSLKEGASRAVDLTKQLLTFSKGGKPIRKPENILNIIYSSKQLVMTGSKSKCIIELDKYIPRVFVDKGQISQVINNLLINSKQAMNQGGTITIGISKVIIDQNAKIPLAKGEYVKVSIHDEGTGIPPKNQDKIFVPYFTTKPKGTGLGLATSYSIIKNHDGYMDFKSKENQYTQFNIYLPVSKVQAENIEGFEEKFSELINKKSRRALIIDDNYLIHKTLRKMLERLNIESISAFDSKEAISAYKKSIQNNSQFDVVIIDLTIPGDIGGKEIIKELIKLNPDIKAVVSSGYSNDPIMSKYSEYGFKGRLVKPYVLEQLKSEIFKLLN